MIITATDSGSVTYIVPKNNTATGISLSAISGEITTTITSQLHSNNNPNLTSIVANDLNYLAATPGLSITNIIAPKVVYCNVYNCSLTAKAIGEILYAAYLEDRQNVNFTFSGGSNANSTSIDSYLQATYGVALAAVIVRLDVTGTILLNA